MADLWLKGFMGWREKKVLKEMDSQGWDPHDEGNLLLSSGPGRIMNPCLGYKRRMKMLNCKDQAQTRHLANQRTQGPDLLSPLNSSLPTALGKHS